MQFFFHNNCGDHDYEKHFDCLLFYRKYCSNEIQGRVVKGCLSIRSSVLSGAYNNLCNVNHLTVSCDGYDFIVSVQLCI
jgi:hypothetical protein